MTDGRRTRTAYGRSLRTRIPRSARAPSGWLRPHCGPAPPRPAGGRWDRRRDAGHRRRPAHRGAAANSSSGRPGHRYVLRYATRRLDTFGGKPHRVRGYRSRVDRWPTTRAGTTVRFGRLAGPTATCRRPAQRRATRPNTINFDPVRRRRLAGRGAAPTLILAATSHQRPERRKHRRSPPPPTGCRADRPDLRPDRPGVSGC